MVTGPQGLVFRGGARRVRQDQLAAALAREVAAAAEGGGREEAVRALLSAGAFECALADADPADPLLSAAMALTDRLARVAMGAGAGGGGLAGAAARVSGWGAARALPVSVPDGFAYYALDPCRFGAEVVAGERADGVDVAPLLLALRVHGRSP